MNILRRYIARETISSTLLVLVAFLGLFAFFDFVNELDSIGKDGYQLHHALIYVALIMPGRVYELMPIAVLIGTLYALTNLARHSEITVMRASGLSTARLLGLLVSVGMLFVVLTFIFGEYVAPPAEKAAQQWRLTATGSTVSNELRSGLWVRDGKRFINVQTLTPERTMKGVRIYEFDNAMALSSISHAEAGEYRSGDGWHLTGISRTVFEGDRTRIEQVKELSWQSDLTPEVLSVLMVTPERMSVTTLYAYLRHLEENAQKTDRYEIALWKKLVYPFAVLVMMALALPFAYSHDRMGGVSVKVFAGIMLGVAFHLLNGLFSNLGVINAWSAPVAALAPSALFLLAATAMMIRVERR